MMEYYNVSLFKFMERKVDKQTIPVAVQHSVSPAEFPMLPVVLKVGAVHHRLGFVNEVRIGREEVFGDLRFELTGRLEFEVIQNEKGEPTSIKPTRYVFERENPSA